MDIHPSGFPGLVGPAGGSDFSHFDFSSQFRILPNNTTSEITPPNLDSLHIRSHVQPLQMHASPSNSPRFPQPLRLRDDNGNDNSNSKAGSPRPAAPPHHLLASDPIPLLQNIPPSKRLSHSISSPARLVVEEMEEDEVDLLPAASGNDNGVTLVLED